MKPTSVDEYIQAEPKPVQVKLRQMQACIRAAAPGATESLKWSVPAYSYRRILVMFGAFQHHIGFYPTPSAVRAFKKRLTNYKTATGSIQFPLDQPLPRSLIKAITKFRVKELKERDGKWKG
jgi:uncharacterized protein YdhG (YjbR/CyaY superfamily)